jgi:hypothetical protein
VIGADVFEKEINEIMNSPASSTFDDEETETDESTSVESVIPKNVTKDVPPIKSHGKMFSLVINKIKSEDLVGKSVRMLYTVEVDKSGKYIDQNIFLFVIYFHY